MKKVEKTTRPFTYDLNQMPYTGASLVVPVVKKVLPANAGDIRDCGLIPGSRWSPEEARGNPLQYSCLENNMHRGVWQAMVNGAAKRHNRSNLAGRHNYTGRVTKSFKGLDLIACLQNYGWKS